MNVVEFKPTERLWKNIMKKKQLKMEQLENVKNAILY
jgi:hypothetical protein